MKRAIHTVFLAVLAIVVYVGVAGEPGVMDDADGGHAVAAREILLRNDWTVLHINGVRYLEKAPLHYWLVALSYRAFGENAFATRLPLALGVVALVLMTAAFGRHFFGARAGLYSGLAIGTGIGVFIFTRAMIPEAIYAFFFTAAFYLFLRAWEGSLPARWGYWGCAAVIALAVLTRGLIGMIFPLATIGLFLLMVRGRDATGGARWRELPFWSSVAVFLLIAAPWHVLISVLVPEFFNFYFFNEHFLRALGWRYPKDYGSVPLLLWWVEHLVWLFPWSIFWLLAAKELPGPGAWRRLDRAGQAKLLVMLWAAVILVFFSVSKRMEYYSFGAWPALALLAGMGLARAEEDGSVWLRRLTAGLAVLGLAIAAVLCALVWVARSYPAEEDITRLLELQRAEHYRVAMSSFSDLTVRAFATLRWPALGAAAAFLVALVAPYFVRRRGYSLAATVVMALGMAGFVFAANAGFRAFEPHMSSRPLAERLKPLLKPEDQVAIYGDFYGGASLAFYLQRQTWLVNGRVHSLEFGSNFPDAPKIFLTDQDFPAFWNSEKRVFLFAPQHGRREVLLRLPHERAWLVTEMGGKAIYCNQPVYPGQVSLAEMKRQEQGR